MDRGIKTTAGIALFAAVIMLTCGVAWAVPSNPYVSTLTSTAGGFSDTLTATVTQVGGLYHYDYDLDFAESYSSRPMTSFSIGNLNNLDFLNVGNDQGFANPTYNVQSLNSILWVNINLPVGTNANFWFDSPDSYQEVSTALVAGRTANGTTLGLVPEPAAAAALIAGGLATLGFVLRRRAG